MRWSPGYLLVTAMPPISKLRLSILLLFLQLFVYLYVVPRGHPEEQLGGYPLEEDCQLSFKHAETCPSGHLYFKELAGNCGVEKEKPPVPEPVPEEPPPPEPEQEPVPEEQPEVPQPEEVPPAVAVEEEQVPPAVAVLKEETNNTKSQIVEEITDKPTETVAKTESVHEKSGHLIYQIIVVLLFVSVSFALADCFQERAKKKANPKKYLLLPRERRQQSCNDCSRETTVNELIKHLNEVKILLRDFSAEVSNLMCRHSQSNLKKPKDITDTVRELPFRPVADVETLQLQRQITQHSALKRFRSFESEHKEEEDSEEESSKPISNEESIRRKRMLFSLMTQGRVIAALSNRKYMLESVSRKFPGKKMLSIAENIEETENGDEAENIGEPAHTDKEWKTDESDENKIKAELQDSKGLKDATQQ